MHRDYSKIVFTVISKKIRFPIPVLRLSEQIKVFPFFVIAARVNLSRGQFL